ncbi:MAG TPA: FtsX-like permease family protein [Cyclobacteriaceae bacterium]|nr:FtsX-like permease family protein [Cyclobacteriaceae bacterium]
MLKNFLVISFRNLLKNKIFVFINVFGLSIALANCVVAWLNWQYNHDFDTQYVNAGSIYRVNFIRIMNDQPRKNGSCPMPLGNILRDNFSQISRVVRVFPAQGSFKVGDDLFRTTVNCVDPEFFEMFTFDMIHGTPAEIRNKTRIYISDILAEKYFAGIANPVGQVMTYMDGDQRIELSVGGVFRKPPQNSTFYREDAYVLFDNIFDITKWDENDWSIFNTTFVEIKNAGDVAAVEEGLKQYVEIQNKAKEDYKVANYYLDPLIGMAVRAEKDDLWNSWFNNSLPISAAIAPGIMAALLLLLACFNFTNTSIAMANKRIREIGIRKVLGSGRVQLISQFLGENCILAFLALIAGILIASFLVPLYSDMWTFLDISLNLLENANLIGFLFVLLLLTAIIAGSYPAFYVSSFQPVSILKGIQKYGGINFFMITLLTLQFAFSIISIFASFAFSQNAEFQKTYDIGFHADQVLIAGVSNAEEYRTFKNELGTNSKIKTISGSAHSVAYSWYLDPIRFESQEYDADVLGIGDNYLTTIGATLVAGRDFIKDNQNDIDGSTIVNQEMVRLFGWTDPIGQRIMVRDTIPLYVVGVVKDLYLDGGLWNPMRPLVMRYVPEKDYHFLSVRAELEDLKSVRSEMEAGWKKLFPDKLASINYLDENKAQAAEVNNNIKIIFVFLGIVAMILSVIGLYSLVSLNIIKRTKEIGVRKVLGASIPGIITNLSRVFLIILFIASVIGSTAGYFLSKLMMGSIWAYYLPLGISPFILSISVIFLICAITVGWKIHGAASLNPTLSLRNE